MDRTYRLRDLRRRLLEMTGNVNDESFSIPELNEALISAAAETIDHIITSGLSDQTLKYVDFNTAAGTQEYDMSSSTYVPSQDFYKISKVFVNEGSNQFRPIDRINLSDMQAYRPPQAAVSVRVYYIPLATNFKDSAGEYNDDATFDGINGWEEHTLCTAAATLKNKKDEDIGYFSRRKEELEERMAFMGNTDFSGPARVIRRRGRKDSYFPYQQQLSAWAISGKKLNLFYAYPWVP